MKKEDREEFWEEYWNAFYESLVPIWAFFAIGVALILIGLLCFPSWKMFSAIALISIGAILAVIIQVRIFLSLVKKYKNKKK